MKDTLKSDINVYMIRLLYKVSANLHDNRQTLLCFIVLYCVRERKTRARTRCLFSSKTYKHMKLSLKKHETFLCKGSN